MLETLTNDLLCLERWKILEMDGGDGCTTIQMYLMPWNCALKMVEIRNFILSVDTVKQRSSPNLPPEHIFRWTSCYPFYPCLLSHPSSLYLSLKFLSTCHFPPPIKTLYAILTPKPAVGCLSEGTLPDLCSTWPPSALPGTWTSLFSVILSELDLLLLHEIPSPSAQWHLPVSCNLCLLQRLLFPPTCRQKFHSLKLCLTSLSLSILYHFTMELTPQRCHPLCCFHFPSYHLVLNILLPIHKVASVHITGNPGPTASRSAFSALIHVTHQCLTQSACSFTLETFLLLASLTFLSSCFSYFVHHSDSDFFLKNFY